jgi:hypothetical protein
MQNLVYCVLYLKYQSLLLWLLQQINLIEGTYKSLGLHNCFELVANSDRKNIFYEKTFRYQKYALEDICRPIYAVVYAKDNVYVLSVA